MSIATHYGSMERKQHFDELRSKGLTYESIGKLFGISRQRVHQIVSGYKSKQLKHWTKTGLSLLAEKIRIRDNHICQKCGEIWKEGMRRFDVHHLEPEFEGVLTYEAYKRFDKMITLCHKCHIGLPHNRIKISEGLQKAA